MVVSWFFNLNFKWFRYLSNHCSDNSLNGTCELLSDPVLDLLKKKLKEFIRKYQKDDHPDFDWELYEKSIIELKKELNKGNVKKVLNSFLKNDILNNIEMKLSIK